MGEKAIRLALEAWEKLNYELVEKVLSKLPFQSLMRFRSVCKRWKISIDSCGFIHPRESSKPVLFYHHPGGEMAGNEELCEEASLAFHDSSSSRWERQIIPFAAKHSSIADTLVAVEGGLLCFSNALAPNRFTVYNPISKQFRDLQLAAKLVPEEFSCCPFEFMLLGLVVNPETGNYKLVAAGIHEESPFETFVYDSFTRSWKQGGWLPVLVNSDPEENREWGERRMWKSTNRGVCRGGCLYWFVHYEMRNFHMVERALLKYNVELEEWSFVKEAGLSIFPSNFQIVAHNDDVILVDWYDNECWEEGDESRADFQYLGDEIKKMDCDLVNLDHEWQGHEYWRDFSPVRSLSQRGVFYIVHQHHFKHSTFRVLVFDKSKEETLTWLPEWKFLRAHHLVWAFTPTLRAFV